MVVQTQIRRDSGIFDSLVEGTAGSPPGFPRETLGWRRAAAHVAQLAEHVLGKDEVTGSIPVMGSVSLRSALKTNIEVNKKRYG